MKKILSFAITIIVASFFLIPFVDGAKPTGYYKKLNGTCHTYPNIPHDTAILGFCIQPGATYTDSETYYNCDAGLTCYEAAVAYYGAVVNTNHFWQAQSILNGRTFYSDNNCTNVIATTDAANYANSYCMVPNLGNTTLDIKVGETKTFTDSNSTISNYSTSYSSSAFTVTKVANGISITGLSAATNQKLVLWRGSTTAITGHCSNNSQNYVTVNSGPYLSSNITININENVVATTPKYGTLRLLKVDEGGAPLEGVRFKVGTNLNGTENTHWKYETTNSEGLITVSSIPVGSSYYYQEVETLNGYIMDNSIKYIYIKDETTYTIRITNNAEDTGMIKITKINQYGDRLSNVTFKIGTDINGVQGTDWNTYTTDQYGEIVIPNLAINTILYAKETATLEGYDFNPDTVYRLEINEEQLIDDITITNTLRVDRLLKIIKRTTETNDIIPNVKINVYNEDETLYYEGTTDENGEIYVSNIPDGNYYLLEMEAPNGYVKLNDRYEFTISTDTPTVTIELFNDLKNQKTGAINIVIPFIAISALGIGVYLILKNKQKLI